MVLPVAHLNKIAGKWVVFWILLRTAGRDEIPGYETPGGTVLWAHCSLESITLDRDTMHFKTW